MTSKVALITGAARRLGAEIAQSMAGRGFTVIAHANSSQSEASSLVETIIRGGGKAVFVAGDLTVEAERERVLRKISDIDTTIDVLVNNASFFEYDFPGNGNYDLLIRSLDIHVKVPFLLIEHFAKKSNPGRPLDVFNILDQKLDGFNPDYFSYTVGKAGLYAISKCWQAAGSAATRVFGILPGNMFPSGPQTTEEFAASSGANLLQRAPTAADVCDAIHFFHSHRGLPAQNLPVDAGERLANRARDPAFDKRFTARK